MPRRETTSVGVYSEEQGDWVMEEIPIATRKYRPVYEPLEETQPTISSLPLTCTENRYGTVIDVVNNADTAFPVFIYTLFLDAND